jgi:hypothetical protein
VNSRGATKINREEAAQTRFPVLKYFGRIYRMDPLIGDLLEQFESARSNAWYRRQVLMLVLGGLTMVRIAVSILSLVIATAVSVGMAYAAFFHTGQWHGSAVGMLGSFNCLLLLLLLVHVLCGDPQRGRCTASFGPLP